jgi:hypothetical protein
MTVAPAESANEASCKSSKRVKLTLSTARRSLTGSGGGCCCCWGGALRGGRVLSRGGRAGGARNGTELRSRSNASPSWRRFVGARSHHESAGPVIAEPTIPRPPSTAATTKAAPIASGIANRRSRRTAGASISVNTTATTIGRSTARACSTIRMKASTNNARSDQCGRVNRPSTAAGACDDGDGSVLKAAVPHARQARVMKVERAVST